MKAATPAEICKAISADFKMRGLTHEKAADLLGTTKQTVSNQISGKKKFSVNMARKYHETFGYDVQFLLYGEGKLMDQDLIEIDEMLNREGVDLKERRFNRRLQQLLRLIGNDNLDMAVQALCEDNEEEYEEYFDKLAREYGWDIPLVFEQENALAEIRKFFAHAQELANKEKIQAEQRALREGTIDIKFMVEKYHKELISLKRKYNQL